MNWVRTNLAYMPLVVFVLLGYNGGAESIEQWGTAWRYASLLALAALVMALQADEPADRIFIAVNAYLLIGGLLAWAGLGQWLAVFGGYLRGVSLFLVILVAGLVFTFRGDGFVNMDSSDKDEIRKRSLKLLAITLACTAFAWVFRGSLFYEGTLPFFVLYIAYMSLSKKTGGSPVQGP